MKKLSKLLNISGIIIIASSIIRWFFLYYDPSQAILGTAIGIILLGFADIYNARKVLEDRIEKVDRRVNAFEKWLTREDWK